MEFIEKSVFIAGVCDGNVISWQFSLPSISDVLQVSHSEQSSQQSNEDRWCSIHEDVYLT